MVSANGRLTRREFLAGSALAAGYALAVRPIAAETITTSGEGMLAGVTRIDVGGGALPAYRARPADGAAHPVVLVVHEIFGVHEYIRDVCRRLARHGYLAIAPDLFARQGDVKGLSSIDEIREVVARVPDEQALADLDAAAKWAAKEDGDPSRLAVTGFCWGGRMTWLYAAHNPELRAAVAWYGRLVGDASERTPRQPIDVAPQLKVPVLGLYGAEDGGIPLDTVERMRAAIAKGKSGSEILVYPGAPHGFHADYRPSYRKPAAEEGWKGMLDWLRRHGAA
jgi:carboxymethylenebutenolidase